MILLDTNVISALMGRRDDPIVRSWLDRHPASAIWTTAITCMELRYGVEIMPAGRRRDTVAGELRAVLEDDLEGRIVTFDHACAEATAILMGSRRRAGRQGELRDSMIAGIATARGATLATRNTRHFDDLPLPVVNPWHD